MRISKKRLLKVLKMEKRELKKELKRHRDAVAGTLCILWFKSKGLPCLVAHVDTVYDNNPLWHKRSILHNDKYIWSPQGIGGDDRCGVYALMELYDKLEVNCLFTDLEEVGGKGAKEACKRFKEQLEDTPYFIEIDRRGYKEAVFYNGEEENREFFDTIMGYFDYEIGSFSDVSILGEYFEVCSVNLSAGFYNEHSKESEYIYLPSLEYTIKTIPKLIKSLRNKKYELPLYTYLADYEYEYDEGCLDCPFYTPYYCYAREDFPEFGAKGCIYEKDNLTNNLTIESDFNFKPSLVGKSVKKKKIKKKRKEVRRCSDKRK